MSIDITKELHQNFIDFAYEANSQRAFPDVRDGLKPGQRACLWEFYTKGYTSSKPHVKSAKVSGGVIADWWPHGDVAIYDTFVRMSQPWINNIPEVDFHGSNGNQVIGPEAASSRYTEARLSPVIEQGMFEGIKKKNVPMIPNFSEDKEWPEVLPAVLPRLLINGSQGIGVTVANHWTLFNLKETVTLINKYTTSGILDTNNYYPDYPTGGIIINKKDIPTIYSTGKGKVVVRAKTEVQGNNILITELPYQTYVEPLITKIKELVEKEEINGIDDIINKSDKKHLLIEIQCSNAPLTVLNKLFATTDLQKSFSPNQYALVGKTPKLLNLQQYLDLYIEHNLTCIKRENEFEVAKAKERKEIVEGLVKALEDIDNIIALIKSSESSSDAQKKLEEKYQFTHNQSKAIVSMRLGTLAKLEAIELNKELKDLIENIAKYENIIQNVEEQKAIFLDRLQKLSDKFGTERKTQVAQIEITKEEKEIEYVEPEKCVVVMTESGLIKRIPTTSFRKQNRNTKGVKTQDDITHMIIRTNTIDNLMIFSDKGKMYRLLVDDIPVGTNASQGTNIKALVPMESDEIPATIYSIYRETDAKYVLFATKNGLIKRTSLDEYIKTKKKSGIQALKINEGDKLVAVSLMSSEEVIVITKQGMSIRFSGEEISVSGRAAAGVKSISLKEKDEVVAVLPIRDSNDDVAVFTEAGLGKRISLSELTLQKRGGKGLSISKTPIACAAMMNEKDKVLLMGDKNNLCISGEDIPVMGRNAAGNQMIKNNKIISVSKV